MKKRATNGIDLISTRLLLVIVVISVVVFLVVDKCRQRENANRNRSDCWSELNKQVSGRVKKAFFDENPNHKGFVIEFTNGSNYRPLYLTKWQPIVLSEGDSINKKPGTFKVVIYKQNQETPIVIEDTVDCNN